MDPRRRLARLAPPLFFAALVLGLCWQVWDDRAFTHDALWGYWGDVAVQIHAARRGELPLWDPYDRLGYPFFADPQPGTTYPLQWPLVALGVAVGPTWWLVAAKILFHLWWLGLGVHVWLRHHRLPHAACAAAGVFCILAYPVSTGWFSALNWGMAWAPWVILAAERWAARPAVRRAAVLALALAMTWLAGAPASFWYVLLVAGPIAAWAVAVAWRDASDRRAFVRAAAASAAVAAGLFGAMVAAPLCATAELVPHTVRATRDLDFIADSVLSGDNLFSLVTLRLPGLHMYFGMAGIFAALVAVTVRPNGRTYLHAALAVFGLLLAVGSDGGWLPSLASVLPPAGLFRRAHRYVLVSLVPFAALAAEGLAILSRLDEPEVRRRVARLLVALGAAGVVIFGGGLAGAPPAAVAVAFALSIAAWAGAALLLRQVVVGRARQAWLAAAALFWCVEVGAGREPHISRNFTAAPRTDHDAALASLPGVPLSVRIFDRGFAHRPGARLAIRDLGGYEDDPLALRRYAGFMRLVAEDLAVAGHANVGPVVGRDGRVAALADVAPAVAWYAAPRIVDDEAAALREVRRMPVGSGAVLERPTLAAAEIAALATPPAPPVSGRLVSLDLGGLVAEVEAPGAGVVVIAEAHHPGWTATVDGAPAKVVPANGALRGVVVGSGRHVIRMAYGGGATPSLIVAQLLAMILAGFLALKGRD